MANYVYPAGAHPASESLPPQAGRAGQILTTNGIEARWSAAGDLNISNSYPEFATFAELPATPAVNTIAVVLVATGIPFINRRAAGLYRYDGTEWLYLGPLPEDYFSDSVMEIRDNADPTKKVRFEVSGVSTGTTRVFTFPDMDAQFATTADLDQLALEADLDVHVGNTSNPHATTAAQVGLGNVDNTSDLNKPISTATQTALDLKANQSALNSHVASTANPHLVTKAQVGLGNVDNTSDLNKPVSTATQAALNLKADLADLPTQEIGPEFTYTNGVVTRIDYDSGNYRLFTYTLGVLTQLDYVVGTTTIRKVFNYNLDGSLASITQTEL